MQLKNNTMSNQVEWMMDQTQSTISFKVDPLIFASVEGTFKIFSANIYTSDNNFDTIKVNLLIDASSINTGDAERDDHLKSTDFFDVQNYKQILFTSTSIKVVDSEGNYDLTGILTIKNIAVNVKMRVKLKDILSDAEGNKKAEFVIACKVNRNDWWLIWNESNYTGGLMESEFVHISCGIILTRLPIHKLKGAAER